MNQLPPIADVLPHRPPMLLLDRVVSQSERGGVAEARIGREHPLMRTEGYVEALVAVELVAQTAAAVEGERLGGRQVGGALVGVRDFRLDDPVPMGATVTIEIERGERSRIFREVSGRVHVDGRPVGEGAVKLVVGEAARGEHAPGVELPAREPWDRSIFPLLGRYGTPIDGGALFDLPPSLPAFYGHFPGAPVLPAVVTLALVAATARGDGARLRRVARARFGRAIQPGATARVEVSRYGDVWKASVLVDGASAATATFTLAETPAG